MFKNASHAPSFIVIVSFLLQTQQLDFELFWAYLGGLHLRGPKRNRYIPGLGAPVLYMLPLLPLAVKRIDFVSGSQGSD